MIRVPGSTGGRPVRASTPEEFAAFSALSQRLIGFDPTMTPFYIDGWLTAMATGPLRLDNEQWLELLFGDTFERTFADPPDRAQALAVLQTRLDVLHAVLDAQALIAQPDTLRLDPFLDDWTDEDRQRLVEAGAASEAEIGAAQTGAIWAEGVLDGLDVLADLWQLPFEDDPFEQDFSSMVDQIRALSAVPSDEGWSAFIERYHGGQVPDRELLLDNACFAVQDLRLLLLDHGPRPETRRVGPQPGRNDPCPCGSGKKYKKCHGAAA